MLLVGLIAFVNGKPPLLEGDTTKDKTAKVKVEPLNSTEKVTQEAQGAETKVNVDVSKLLSSRSMELWREIILRMGCHLLVWCDK